MELEFVSNIGRYIFFREQKNFVQCFYILATNYLQLCLYA